MCWWIHNVDERRDSPPFSDLQSEVVKAVLLIWCRRSVQSYPRQCLPCPHHFCNPRQAHFLTRNASECRILRVDFQRVSRCATSDLRSGRGPSPRATSRIRPCFLTPNAVPVTTRCIWYQSIGGDALRLRESNCMSSIVLAMHLLQWSSHYELKRAYRTKERWALHDIPIECGTLYLYHYRARFATTEFA